MVGGDSRGRRGRQGGRAVVGDGESKEEPDGLAEGCHTDGNAAHAVGVAVGF